MATKLFLLLYSGWQNQGSARLDAGEKRLVASSRRNLKSTGSQSRTAQVASWGWVGLNPFLLCYVSGNAHAPTCSIDGKHYMATCFATSLCESESCQQGLPCLPTPLCTHLGRKGVEPQRGCPDGRIRQVKFSALMSTLGYAPCNQSAKLTVFSASVGCK